MLGFVTEDAGIEPRNIATFALVKRSNIISFFKNIPQNAEWLERLTSNAKVATVLSSNPASSDTVESEWRQKKG
jgi:hypothetical protein